ncbi:MAG: Cell wall hydrolyses involved in spore germination, partial [uncultured Sphingomonas sp.]
DFAEGSCSHCGCSRRGQPYRALAARLGQSGGLRARRGAVLHRHRRVLRSARRTVRRAAGRGPGSDQPGPQRTLPAELLQRGQAAVAILLCPRRTLPAGRYVQPELVLRAGDHADREQPAGKCASHGRSVVPCRLCRARLGPSIEPSREDRRPHLLSIL